MAFVCPIRDLDLSSLEDGVKVEVKCIVRTCLSEFDIQFFRDSDLMDSSTSIVDTGWVGTLLITVAQYQEDQYMCQATNDISNIVWRRPFRVTGKHNDIVRQQCNIHRIYVC